MITTKDQSTQDAPVFLNKYHHKNDCTIDCFTKTPPIFLMVKNHINGYRQSDQMTTLMQMMRSNGRHLTTIGHDGNEME